MWSYSSHCKVYNGIGPGSSNRDTTMISVKTYRIYHNNIGQYYHHARAISTHRYSTSHDDTNSTEFELWNFMCLNHTFFRIWLKSNKSGHFLDFIGFKVFLYFRHENLYHMHSIWLVIACSKHFKVGIETFWLLGKPETHIILGCAQWSVSCYYGDMGFQS